MHGKDGHFVRVRTPLDADGVPCQFGLNGAGVVENAGVEIEQYTFS